MDHPVGAATDLTRRPLEVVERPWGDFRTYAKNESCTVKVITVVPGGELSLQWHHHRDEFWVVLDDGLEIVIGDETHPAKLGEEFRITRGEQHRIRSRGDDPARVLEVAFGDFAEEDIVRLADAYGRAGEPPQ